MIDNNMSMYVVKRSGEKEAVAFEKVQERIVKASEGLAVNAIKVAQGVLTRLMDGITTTELDTIAANLAFSWSTTHPDYGVLAGRIAISSHQKNTPTTMLECVETLHAVRDRAGAPASLLSDEFVAVVRAHGAEIEAHMDYSRDFLLDYFGFKTLERAYLLRDTARRVVERPQHLWMRVALGLWYNDLPRAFALYDMLSRKQYTHATPTLFNAGTKRPQLSSCFLLAMKADSIHGIYDTLKDCALISQYGGGIGVHISNIRAQGSLIRGTGGVSNGVVPMLRVFNNTARYVDQCFLPETLVYTSTGSMFIRDVTAGMKVMTSAGDFKPVTAQVVHQYAGPVCRIRMSQDTPGMSAQESVCVTPEHPLLAVQAVGGAWTREEMLARLAAGLVAADFTEVRNLRVGDWVASNIDSDPTQIEWFLIESMEEEMYDGPVYDFEVDAPHDYTVVGLGIAHNGGGKRNGSFAMYLEPWHADIEAFLDMKRNTGAEEERARDLFYGLWIPDLFMERVDAGGDWTLFCPNEAPGLADVVGDEFRALYTKYEAEGRGKRVVAAQTLWFRILDSQIETGTPYLLYKDAANRKSNQQNLGVIKSSNLCTEIIEYSSPTETAVCNLASLSLPAFIHDGVFDFAEFRRVVYAATQNLDRVIDITFYPIPEAERSNRRHRPIGLGVQGLADVFAMLNMPWESAEAADLNRRIFAHMYFAACEASCDLAAKHGPYETWVGSPAHGGRLQYDLWGVEPEKDEGLDWDRLVNDIRRIGMRNSLLVAPMPTASTSQILGNCECIEPYTTHIFTRRTLAGEFIIVNRHLVRALMEAGVWNEGMKDRIIANNGSIQGLAGVPEDVQRVFKTVWEIKQKTLIDMAADRGPYVCQSQSLNLFLGDPDYRKLTSMHFYAWRRGLKTGIYYLRTRAVAAAQKFTVDPSVTAAAAAAKSIASQECLMCSS
jgi:ribonucleoside-diphosphate reductase alpha subunit